MLEEGVSNHRHERMAVEALPGAALEVVETELLLQLLVSHILGPQSWRKLQHCSFTCGWYRVARVDHRDCWPSRVVAQEAHGCACRDHLINSDEN